MGVTTLVLGNCGSSKLNIGDFYRQIGEKGFSPNIASLIGHGTVRKQVMGGSFRRPPSTSELAQMQKHVENAMIDGALGMSTGLIYLPGTFAKTEELIALSQIVSRHGGIYVSHMRSEGTNIFYVKKANRDIIKITIPEGTYHYNDIFGFDNIMDKVFNFMKN